MPKFIGPKNLIIQGYGPLKTKTGRAAQPGLLDIHLFFCYFQVAALNCGQ
jgi:hypothetical protein